MVGFDVPAEDTGTARAALVDDLLNTPPMVLQAADAAWPPAGAATLDLHRGALSAQVAQMRVDFASGRPVWPMPSRSSDRARETETAAREGAPRGRPPSQLKRGLSTKYRLTSLRCSPRTRLRIKLRIWTHSVFEIDPRRQLGRYFRYSDEQGPMRSPAKRKIVRQLTRQLTSVSEASISEVLCRSERTCFAVFRPTSLDAIRMMIEGRGTGKALNVKGKSAKRGRYAGFVPMVQISTEEHKRRCATAPPAARTLVYFQTAGARAAALAQLEPVLEEMQRVAVASLRHFATTTSGHVQLPATAAGATSAASASAEESKPLRPRKKSIRDPVGMAGFQQLVDVAPLTLQQLLAGLTWRMDEPQVRPLDGYAPAHLGLDMPERLFWEAFVVRQDLAPPPGCETGRASEPGFMVRARRPRPAPASALLPRRRRAARRRRT
jgi:hypothetical protein